MWHVERSDGRRDDPLSACDASASRPEIVRGLFGLAREWRAMKSTRKGLREDDLFKDTYERLNCAVCEQTLAKENPPDEIYAIRRCPDCGREWKELR